MKQNWYLQIVAASLVSLSFGCNSAHDEQRAEKTARREILPPNGEQVLALTEEFIRVAPSRDAGSAGGLAAAEWIAGQLRSFGLDSRIDTFSDRVPGGAMTFHNVIAEFRPATSNAEWVVMLSHFDTKAGIPGFVGANDGASSTALLLKIAESVSKIGGDGKHAFIFAFTDGEECRVRYGRHDGLHGSRYLASRLKDEQRAIRAVVLLDMIGDRDLHVEIPRNGDQSLTLKMLSAAEKCGLRGYFGASDSGVLDDHQPFLDAGFPAIDLIDFKYGSMPGANDYWHTAEDTLDKLSAESLGNVGRVVVEFLNSLDY